MSNTNTILTRLMAVIEDRRAHPSDKSYTSRLFAGGVDKIGEKIVEEAAEVVEAAHEATTPEGRAHLVHEAADLIYHLFVMLGFREITLAEVEAQLAGRFGISGLEEKASRPPKEQSS
ncbi:MAG TPA: phosphoribosyl-ATP diphosphatase [Pirellulales bacterium]|nr:phosphoribosyl-ATP diphosphatase [Pirellulales bacterium]